MDGATCSFTVLARSQASYLCGLRSAPHRTNRERDFVFDKDKDKPLKTNRPVDPDDVLTRDESAAIAKARREMHEGKYVTLAQVEHELARKRPSRRNKRA